MTAATPTDRLRTALDAQRAHVLGILEGLDDDALRAPVLPSGWSCAGLVQHLAVDVERFWFRAVVAGEQAVVDGFRVNPGNAWAVGPDVPARSVLEAYRHEVARADEIITATAPTAPPAWWPADQFGDRWLGDLQDVLLHVVTETACHAGHLDAARELIDGRTWLVLT